MSIEEDQKQEDQKEEDNDLNESNPPTTKSLPSEITIKIQILKFLFKNGI